MQIGEKEKTVTFPKRQVTVPVPAESWPVQKPEAAPIAAPAWPTPAPATVKPQKRA